MAMLLRMVSAALLVVAGRKSKLGSLSQTRPNLRPSEPEPEFSSVSVGTQTEDLPVEFTLDIQHVRLYAPQRVYVVWRLGSSHDWAGVHIGEPGWSGVRRLLVGGAYQAGRDILQRQHCEPGEDLLGAAARTYWAEQRRHGAPSQCRVYHRNINHYRPEK
eukprot:1028301-Amphidinium_carterae.1